MTMTVLSVWLIGSACLAAGAVAVDPETSPDYFRRTVGLKALPQDAASVVSPAGLDAAFAAARDAACEDVRVYREVESLAFALVAKGGAVSEAEARRARRFLARLPVADGDLDLIRMEMLAYRRRLELLLGREPSPVTLPTGGIPNVVKKPPQADLAAFRAVPVAFGGTAKLGGDVTLSVDENFTRVGLVIGGTAAKPLASDDWPGGEVKVRLWIPGKEPGVWCPYRFAANLDKRPWKPMAGGTPDYTRYFGIERRFPDPARGPRFVCEQVRTYDEAYPRINVSYPYGFAIDRKGAKWSFAMDFFTTDIYGFWPGCRNGARDVWYLEVSGCGVDVRAKLEWPRGRAANFARFAGEMAYFCLTPRYDKARGDAFWFWETSENEALFGLPKVAGDVFNAGDLESDRLFRAAYLEPMVADNANLEKVTHSEGWQTPAKIRSESDAVKALVFPKLGRLLHFDRELERARKEYLTLRFAGKRPEPKPARPAETKPAEKGPTLDEGDAIELDDEEF